ncbi:hypothetical protein ACI798_11490 [Geodermatophilus sp. SYSU D01045]
MSRRALAPVSTLLTAALLLTGCGGEEQPAAGESSTAAPSSTTSSTAASSSTASSSATSSAGGSASPTQRETDGDAGTAAPSFPADTRPDTAGASAGAAVTVRDVRTGRHDGFDRVVFEAGGTGTPGWDVRYVDVASSQGSGEEVDVAGEAVLQVTITGAGYPYDTGVEEYAGPDPLPGAGTATVTEVVFDATFEGTTVAFVGTRSQAPFRVYALEAPTRVVVEVADAG